MIINTISSLLVLLLCFAVILFFLFRLLTGTVHFRAERVRLIRTTVSLLSFFEPFSNSDLRYPALYFFSN